MKRKFFQAIFIVAMLGSCHKSQETIPASEVSTSLVFKDQSINIVKIQMEQKGADEVAFSFTTGYELGINKIEVLRGTTPKNLCMFYEHPVSEDSHDFKNYDAIDTSAGPSVNYYMVRYFKTNGEWSYSPLYEIKMKP